MKKAFFTATLVLLFASTSFAVLDYKRATIQFGLIHPQHWSIVDPSSMGMGLPDPASLLIVERAAARELDELDKTKRYSCLLEIEPTYAVFSSFGLYICVFDVKKCVEAP